MTVEVQPGRAMLNFKKLENDGPYGLTLAAGGTMDRVDAIVAYMDLNERACGIMVREGTPAASPVAPAMRRTDVRYEVMLASVYVTKLVNEITQAKITDTRADTSVCGWVCGIIEQVDTSTLFVQWQAAYEEAYAELGDYLAAQKAAWESFFENISQDSVFPVPSMQDVGRIVTVNATGDGYELLPTDTTLSFNGAAADSATVRAYVDGKETFQTVTLTAAGWSNKKQTVAVADVTADEAATHVIVAPDPAAENYSAYNKAGVRCSAQGAGTLTFECEKVPSAALVVNVRVRRDSYDI